MNSQSYCTTKFTVVKLVHNKASLPYCPDRHSWTASLTELRPLISNSWTYTILQSAITADTTADCVASGSPATHQTLRQLGWTGENGHIHLQTGLSVHTPSTVFRHLPPNSARFSYVTDWRGTLYLRAAVHRRGQRPPKGSGTNMAVETT